MALTVCQARLISGQWLGQVSPARARAEGHEGPQGHLEVAGQAGRWWPSVLTVNAPNYDPGVWPWCQPWARSLRSSAVDCELGTGRPPCSIGCDYTGVVSGAEEACQPCTGQPASRRHPQCMESRTLWVEPCMGGDSLEGGLQPLDGVGLLSAPCPGRLGALYLSSMTRWLCGRSHLPTTLGSFLPLQPTSSSKLPVSLASLH